MVRSAASTVPPQPAAHGAHACLAPTAQPPSSHESTQPKHPWAALVHPQGAQPPGDPAGCHMWSPLLQTLGTAQRQGLCLCRRAPGPHFVAEAALAQQGHPWGDSPSPARGQRRDPREGAHPWLGGPWDPRAQEPAPAAPTKPPAAEAVGHCGTWLSQLPRLAVTWSEPQPGGYFWLCITSQLTLLPCCRSPAMHPHARPSSHACVPPTTLGRPGCLRSTRQPHARRRGPASSAHHFASRRLAVMPGARSAGG